MDAASFITQVNWGHLLGQSLGYVLMTLFFLIIGGLIFLYWYYNRFQMDITIFPVRGNGSGGYSVGSKRTNKIKTDNRNQEWTLLKPWFKGETLEPFEGQYIYPGNQVYAYELQGELFPAKVNFNEGKRLTLEPVPSYIRRWQNNKHREINLELSRGDWWTENKHFVMVVGTAFLCLAAVVITGYLSYKFSLGNQANAAAWGKEAASSIAEALKAGV